MSFEPDSAACILLVCIFKIASYRLRNYLLSACTPVMMIIHVSYIQKDVTYLEISWLRHIHTYTKSKAESDYLVHCNSNVLRDDSLKCILKIDRHMHIMNWQTSPYYGTFHNRHAAGSTRRISSRLETCRKALHSRSSAFCCAWITSCLRPRLYALG